MGEVNLSKLLTDSWNLFRKKAWLIILLVLFFTVVPQVVSNVYLSQKLQPIVSVLEDETLSETITLSEIFEIYKQVFIISAPYYIIVFLLGSIVFASLISVLKKKEKEVDFPESVRYGFKNLFKLVLFNLVFLFFISLLYLCFIIPGIIFSIYWIIGIYVYFYEDKGILESLKISKERITGRWWNVFGYYLMLILISILVGFAINTVTTSLNFIIQGTSSNSEVIYLITYNIINSFFSGLVAVYNFIFMYYLYEGLKSNKNKSLKKSLKKK